MFAKRESGQPSYDSILPPNLKSVCQMDLREKNEIVELFCQIFEPCWGSKFALRGRLGWNARRGVRVKLGERKKELSSFDPKTYFSFPSCHRLDIERKCVHVEDWLSRGNDSIACQSSTYTLNMIKSIHIHLSSTRIASQNKMKAKESWRMPMPIRFFLRIQRSS